MTYPPVSRRTFLKQLSRCIASAALTHTLRPSFLLAHAAPSAVKNVVEVFCYGGFDARHLFPYYQGAVADVISKKRATLAIKAEDVLKPAGMNHGSRDNLVGFNNSFNELIGYIESIGAGVALIDQFGITKNSSNSHDIAQKQFRNGSSLSAGNIQQGYMGRLLDITKCPGLAVWSFGLSEPSYMNTTSGNRPMLVGNTLSKMEFTARSFGSFSCATTTRGASCSDAKTGDWVTDAKDDSAFALQAIREIYRNPSEEMPLADALNSALSGAVGLVPVIDSIMSLKAVEANFRPSTTTSNNTFGLSMLDIARTINHLNNFTADTAVKSATKILSVGVGGWDTHSGQASALAKSISILGAGLKGLMQYLHDCKLLEDTLIVVYSEFGRTTAQNGSDGTDHGLAGTAMVLGGATQVKRAVVGPDPAVKEASAKNLFTPQVPVTGLLRQVFGRAGLSTSQLDYVFNDPMPGQDTRLDFLI